MQLTGFWKGEYIIDKLSTLENEELSVPAIIEIQKYDSLQLSLEGIFMEDEQISGIESSSQILGSIQMVNRVSFVRRLVKFHYRKPDGSIALLDESHPDIFYEGAILKDNYMAGTWHRYGTYRKIDDVVNKILPASGHWWVKKMR